MNYNQQNAIIVKGLSKEFRLRGYSSSIKDTVIQIIRKRTAQQTSLFRALDNVCFEVARGETLGIIGANGAGKSTLLSLIAGTMKPTSGTVETTGTISSLLELGAGFHPDFTGRENIFLYGAVMGLRRKQVAEKLERIIDFAGLKSFIDQPVKHYSSGMYVRLAFSVAVEVDPDILLIDEVLAVGDVDFQRKCIEKINEFRSKKKTMLIISHDLKTIQSVSDRILLLENGKVYGIGVPSVMVTEYENLSREKSTKGMRREWGTGKVVFTDVMLCDENGHKSQTFQYGSKMKIIIQYDAKERVDSPVFGFAFTTADGHLIYGNNTQIEKFAVPYIAGKGKIVLIVDELRMGQGTYLFSCSVHSWDHKENYHRLDNFLPFEIISEKNFEGCCFMPCRWQIEES